MAGHSKWKNIQHRKGAQDKLRGKIFTKLIREITVAAREGGADAGSNPRLRLGLDKAFAANMSKDTVERAIQRGTGGGEAHNLREIRYEGYGPAGVAVIVDCMTDNVNRTVSEVRHAFAKSGGNLGTDGSVSYLFKKCGQLYFPKGNSEDKILEIALEAGAEDVVTAEDGSIEVITTPETFETVRNALQSQGLIPESAEVTMLASTETPLDKENAEKMVRLLSILEELDDVQNVYSNADIAEELLKNL